MIKDEMHARLTAAFSPTFLEITDESEQHRGHAGYQEGGQSHWRIVMRASALADLSRIQRHRTVHKALGTDIIARIHALALELS